MDTKYFVINTYPKKGKSLPNMYVLNSKKELEEEVEQYNEGDVTWNPNEHKEIFLDHVPDSWKENMKDFGEGVLIIEGKVIKIINKQQFIIA